MYLNLSNFRGRTSAGGGTSLGPKMGTSVRWGGGLAKFSPDGGDPPVPPGKKPWAAGMRATDCGLRVCGLRATDCRLRATNCGLRVCGLRATDCGLRAVGHRLQAEGMRAAGHRLPAVGHRLRAVGKVRGAG